MSEYFDFVIVGGGSAGCVMANRLSHDPGISVALLEVGGGNRSPIVTMPAATDFYGIGNPLYDWRYPTRPDPSRENRCEVWSRGRGLGGSSAINGLVHMQGLPSDFARWEAGGAEGWSWQEVQGAFGSVLDSGDGTGGLVVNDLSEVHPATKLFLASAEAAGLRPSKRISSDPDPGVGLVQATSAYGRRVSNAAAFLHPASQRPNLTIRTRARVARIQFSGKRATGLQYWHYGLQRQIRAGHIVLAAGTIASPQLLMASGIGPAEGLRSAGIEMIEDRPGVGANLQDHASAYLAYHADFPTLNSETNWTRRLRHGFDWWWHGRGAATTPGGQALAYLRSLGGGGPDVQVQFTPIGYALVDGHLSVPTSPSVTAVVSLNVPRSRGRVTIRAADTRERPSIQPSLLSDDADMRILCDGLRAAAGFIRNGPLGAALGSEMPLSPPVEADDAVLEAFVRSVAGTNFHPAGTCRIGPVSDNDSVVGSNLNIHGLEGISVADASVMPSLVSANINSTVTMIAGRAAQFLLK